jgi:hypothetical protein
VLGSWGGTRHRPGRDEAISSAPGLAGDEETRKTLAAYPVFQIQARRPPLAPSFAESDHELEGSEFESRRLHGKGSRLAVTVRSLSYPRDGFAFY